MTDSRSQQKPFSLDPPRELLQANEMTGRVEKIVFTSPDQEFCVASFVLPRQDFGLTIKGNLRGIVPGETLNVQGEWKNDIRYGWSFSVRSYVPIVSSDPELLESFLGSGMIKGIGKGYAKNIIKHFGDKTLEVLDNEPERLTEVPKLGAKRAASITESWKEQRNIRELMMFLRSHQISPAYTRRLLKHYGEDAARILRSNPYRVSWEVYGIGFMKADEMARGMGIPEESPDRIKAAFHHVLIKASEAGHTYLPQETLIQNAIELLRLDAQLVEKVYAEEADNGTKIQVIVRRNGQVGVCLKSYYHAESGLARLISQFIQRAQPIIKSNVGEQIDAFEKNYRFQLAAQQREAIHQIASGGVSVITGGPGTGKTTLIRALLFCLRDEKIQVALCSPTGRAAQRLSETTGREATTIHRLLRYNPQEGGFTHDAENPLPINMLIIDETSMLDVALAYQLMKAMTPSTAVVFVGDSDQLPSVGAGNVLEDIIESGRARVTRLNVIFRQASQSAIIRNSHKINRGQMPEFPAPTKDNMPDFFFVERDDAGPLRQALLEVIKTRIPSTFNMDPINDVQVLAPMRRGDLGTESLNELLQEHLNPNHKATQIGPLKLKVGDKVIQTSNNYDLEIYNGDIGIVQRISRDSLTFSVQFGKRHAEYQWGEADQLSLAYAITIHKSQGSEYPVCLVVLHNQHFTMLQRNLIYTAVTRGKKLVMILGSKKALKMAVQNHQYQPRLTNLAEWISFPPNDSGEAESLV